MTLTKVLWTALTGSLTIILLMISAWAHDTTDKTNQLEQRLNTTEQHYAAIQSDLQDLREHVNELKDLLKRQPNAH